MTDPNQPVFLEAAYITDPVTKQKILVDRGLTKREYFAAMAMQGILSGELTKQTLNLVCDSGELPETIEAKSAIRFADALISELNKEPKS